MSSLLGGGKKDEGQPTLDAVLAEVNKNLDVKLAGALDNFKKSVLGDVIKQHMEPVTGQLSTLNSALEKLLAGGIEPKPGTEAKGADAAVPPAVNAQLSELTQRLNKQNAALEQLAKQKAEAEARAETTERHSAVRTALSQLPFVNENALQTAFTVMEPKVRRLDDGTLVARIGDSDFPVEAGIREAINKEHGYLLRASGAAGSGATAVTGGARMGKRIDMSAITPGMSAEMKENVQAEIARLYAEQSKVESE